VPTTFADDGPASMPAPLSQYIMLWAGAAIEYSLVLASFFLSLSLSPCC